MEDPMLRWITFKEAAAIVPGNPCEETIKRWHLRGFQYDLPDGEKVVRLQAIQPGKIYYTSILWLNQFFEVKSQLQSAEHAWKNGVDGDNPLAAFREGTP